MIIYDGRSPSRHETDETGYTHSSGPTTGSWLDRFASFMVMQQPVDAKVKERALLTNNTASFGWYPNTTATIAAGCA